MAASGIARGIKGFFGRFPSVFWIVQIFELMERGAYYSMMPILAVHFIFNVGLPTWFGLILTIFMYPFQYGMPILSSAFGEKLGYKKQMTIGFVILFFAYIFLSFANSIPLAILGVMALGFGIGTYKPLVSATIAKATPQDDRNFAYSIYYWTVNFAATFFALIWGVLIMTDVIQESMYAWVFRVSSVFFLVNILVAIFIFREVPRSGKVKTVKDVGRNIKTAFKDRKFVVMIFLIAGFWALYSVTLAPFQTVMYGFHFLPAWFPVILLGVFNPGTIILLGIPLAKFVERLESLKALMMGVVIYLVGMVVVAFLMESPAFAVMGIVIYSIGEFMVAPGYLAFVSKLAPKEKVSAYIGTNFLASFIGIWGGALIFGLLSNLIAVNMGRPHLFWGVVITFGLLDLLGFMIYYKAWGKHIIERAAEIKAMEENIPIEKARHVAYEPFFLKVFDYRKSTIVPVLLIPVILILTFMMGTNVFYGPEPPAPPHEIIWVENSEQTGITGTTLEGDTTDVMVPTSGILTWVNVTLTWQDENVRIGLKNHPDSFEISLVSPNGTVVSKGPDDAGTLTINHEVGEIDIEGGAEWTVEVSCVDAGDIYGFFNRLVRAQDTGNDWSLTVSVTYLEQMTASSSEEL
ncbi:MAG TPA: MFS transporter [Euryarchaeota archaeon]|nr:MAG: hypothetical protein DRN57_07360 [Thermoplasmata archaeon]HHD15443.1 MFS transporter [Euryarchaeota archaeon]